MGQPIERGVVLRRLTDLMNLSGREALSSMRLQGAIGGKIDEIAATTLQIKKAISEGVLSVDVEVFAPAMDVPFKPSEMRDTFEKPGKHRSDGKEENHTDKVICSTALGLRRIIREAPSASSTVRKQKYVLLKSKVLLHSTFNR